MSTQSAMPRSWQPRLRTVIPAALVAGILGSLMAGLVSAVRQARNAAQSSATT